MESLMQPVSLNNFFKCYPWRVHALQLVFLAAVILILFLRYGFWGPQAADAFTVLRESSPVITAFMNGISDWGNAALDSVYAAILIRSFLTRDREGILFSLGYAAMAILYLGVTLQLVKYGLGMPRPECRGLLIHGAAMSIHRFHPVTRLTSSRLPFPWRFGSAPEYSGSVFPCSSASWVSPGCGWARITRWICSEVCSSAAWASCVSITASSVPIRKNGKICPRWKNTRERN